MKKSIKIIKAISEMCSAIILKLDKKEHTAFFAETGFSDDEKELMINTSVKTQKAVKKVITDQYVAILVQVDELKKLSKEKKLVTKADGSDEDTQKQIDMIVSLIMAFIFIGSFKIGDVIAGEQEVMFLAFAKQTLESMGFDGDVNKKAKHLLREWKRDYSLFIGQVLNESTEESIRRIVNKVVRNNIGSSLVHIVGEVEKKLIDYFSHEDERSSGIAQNETLRVGNTVLFLCALSSGKKTKTWKTMGDSRVRPAHKKADGQTVGINEYFLVDGEKLRYPQDPLGSVGNTVRCRCWIQYA